MNTSAAPRIRFDAQTDASWSHTMRGLSNASLAHSPEWLTVIRNAYGHDPLYLSAVDDEGRAALLPAFVVRRPFVGTVVTSMPFLDSGGPCGSSPALSVALVERLMDEARGLGARSVELRCAERLDIASRPAENKVNMTLTLPANPDDVWRRLDGSVRNQVRKAERAGVTVAFGGSENLSAFYDILAARMRDLGSPVHARCFLREVVESFGSRARVALARQDRTIVGGLVALAFKDRLVVPWAACLKEHFASCPNMLLYWETLRSACVEGFGRFDFGRSTRNSGTYRFKRQWGAHEEPLFWYTIPLAPQRSRRTAHANGHIGRGGDLAVKVWQRLPLTLTRHLGPRIRKYLVQ